MLTRRGLLRHPTQAFSRRSILPTGNLATSAL
jgi:hypothetical protein